MVWVHADLLAWGKLMEDVLMRVLVLRRGTAHVTRVVGAQNHRLAVVDTIARAITEARARCFARQFRREELVGGQLAVAVVLHRALGHLRTIGRWVRGGGRQIRLLAGVHIMGKELKMEGELICWGRACFREMEGWCEDAKCSGQGFFSLSRLN